MQSTLAITSGMIVACTNASTMGWGAGVHLFDTVSFFFAGAEYLLTVIYKLNTVRGVEALMIKSVQTNHILYITKMTSILVDHVIIIYNY
jgi:hypothetical protein